MAKRLIAIYLSICLAVCCMCAFVGCDGVHTTDYSAVKDGKYYCYNAVDEKYDKGELIEINGNKCTLTVKMGGDTIKTSGSIVFSGNTFTANCEYFSTPIVICGEREGNGVLRITSQTVDGHAEAVVDYFCQEGKKPAAKPEEKFYAYDTDNGEYNEYDVWTIVGNSCVWSYVDVFTTAVKEYRGTVMFNGSSFVMNISGSFTTADTCLITYSGVRESDGVMRVYSTTTTVYSDLVSTPSVNTNNEVIYYCKKDSKPSVDSSDNNKPDDDNKPDNKPNDNKPNDNKPDDNKPDDNKPDDNKPDDNKPDDNKPDDNKPDDNKPDDNKPEQPENKVFLITFDGNGGDLYNETTSYTVYSDTVKEMPKNLFYWEGYEFIGYNTKADGSGTSVAEGEVFEFTCDQTFYAIWQRVYKVSFEFYREYSMTVSEPNRYVAENVALGKLPHPYGKNNRCFIGWFDSEGKQYNSKSTVDRDITLYAQWETKSVYDDYNAALPEGQQNGHIYVHYKSNDHLRREEGTPPADTTVYGDLALWVYPHESDLPGRLFLPTAVDFGGIVFDIDVTKTYTDCGWDGEKRERGSESFCFDGHNLKVHVVRLSSIYNDAFWSFIGGNVSFHSPGFGPDKVCNVFTDEFQVDRGESSFGPNDGTYTPDLRVFHSPFPSHY